MPTRTRPSLPDYAALADFRATLKKFLQFSTEAAREAGLSPSQHQALLAIKSASTGELLSIGQLAERLQVRHHSAVGLVDRLAAKQLVKRSPDRIDRRKINLKLTARGEKLIAYVSTAHQAELKTISPQLRALLETIAEK